MIAMSSPSKENTFSTPPPGHVRAMFDRVARRYDLMNRLMTFGQDTRWRKEVIRRARLTPGARLLDLGAGTGDLAWEALQQEPTTLPVAVDFSLEMMRMGQRRGRSLAWTAGDALSLPFPENVFDAVVSAFLVRNVRDVPRLLREKYRLLRPGGRLVILDTTRPRAGVLQPLVRLYLRTIIPLLGALVAGLREDYDYLVTSTENFLRAEELAAHMAAAGFRRIGFRRLMFGTVAIHWGEK
ncbi:MAG: ubiquinone/menaquinone biosynthesis methyltransferase [Anaerolineae bacterium]|nr:MAG: ubiquinone/menaquinone biosynthesis methyltransferase [Anaerolineae bacterium]